MSDNIDTGPEVTFFPSTKQKARKQYSCDICRRPIIPGRSYYRFVYKDEDGKIQTQRFCSPNGECAERLAHEPPPPAKRGVYGEWCRKPEACEHKGYCPLDPACDE